MKQIFTALFCTVSFATMAQTTLTNGGFETWGNATPGVATEPTGWFSNKSGSAIAKLGPQTCFKDSTTVHSGSYAVKIVTESYLGTAVNGALTTGVVNAPSITKTAGYIGSLNYSDTTDCRRMSFTGRPDSLVGWYQYTSGGTGEQGKIRAILHTGQYFDPETPTTYHIDPTANKVADLTFLTPTANITTWTRFSMPFTYATSGTPAYIMINMTPSANQGTTVTGSTLWLDDIQTVYKTNTSVENTATQLETARVFASGKNVFVDFPELVEGAASLEIYDVTGRRVANFTVTNNQVNTFNLGEQHAGIYMFRLSNNGFRKTGKISIQ